ncbi:MAG: hypothetical protein FRX49_06988 [Trebouxia sp. A1-2]|nr:MAG: hypothetical protein FRX49_06988 [Trebouxia sp. A1-2]
MAETTLAEFCPTCRVPSPTGGRRTGNATEEESRGAGHLTFLTEEHNPQEAWCPELMWLLLAEARPASKTSQKAKQEMVL